MKGVRNDWIGGWRMENDRAKRPEMKGLKLPNFGPGLRLIHTGSQIAGPEPVIDIDHRDIGTAAAEHAE